MTTTLQIDPVSPSDRSDYGQARIRDQAFDVVQSLWRRRRDAGLKQSELAEKLGWDPAVVSKKLSGPSNWTFRTFGELIEALDGEIEIQVFGKEDADHSLSNHHAYDDLDDGLPTNRPRLGGDAFVSEHNLPQTFRVIPPR